jgi:XTP/dITP diphosphohydrolase
MRLLIATTNKGKKDEYMGLLMGLDLELTTLTEMDVHTTVEENGNTYAENALLKARGYAALTGLLTLADDSGLEVDALHGAPGVLTARYGGEGLNDQERYQRVLGQLEGVPENQRTARFRCAIVLAWPDNRTAVVEGTCEGIITNEPRGQNGFGYDPIFLVPEFGCTMAELPAEVKNGISHRARAAALAREILRKELG